MSREGEEGMWAEWEERQQQTRDAELEAEAERMRRVIPRIYAGG